MKARKRAEQRQKQELHRQEQAFRRESELKDEEIDSLKAENLQAELRHKSEELARTTLNIVRKNEILLDIKKEVQSIYRSIKEENLVALRRKSLRLLGQIDTNIEHDKDLETFQSSFDSVHHDFFQRLSQAYPELTVKERMLCAYIQMNLLSKGDCPAAEHIGAQRGTGTLQAAQKVAPVRGGKTWQSSCNGFPGKAAAWQNGTLALIS